MAKEESATSTLTGLAMHKNQAIKATEMVMIISAEMPNHTLDKELHEMLTWCTVIAVDILSRTYHVLKTMTAERGFPGNPLETPRMATMSVPYITAVSKYMRVSISTRVHILHPSAYKLWSHGQGLLTNRLPDI